MKAKQPFFLSFFLLLITFSVSGQDPGFCGTQEPTNYSPITLTDHCFTVSTIQQTCTKVWVRVNLHFFLDDNCEGNLHPLGSGNYEMEEVYELAESIINEANDTLENNNKQWNQIPLWDIFEEKPAQCVPYRYALSGVYIYCDSDAKNTNGHLVNFFNNNYGVNLGTDFNGFFVELIGGANGRANGIPGTAFTSESFRHAVINHELGHVFGLSHTFSDYEELMDTPQIKFRKDYNCDGDYLDDWSDQGGLNEDVIPFDAPYCVIAQADPIDYDGDGVIDYQDPCNPGIPGCLPEPGCSWNYTTNNLMGYTKYKETDPAITEDQITRMLDFLSSVNGCDYIEEITDDICAPPMANLHILPTEESESDCAFCFHIEASVNESFYELEFFDQNGNLQYTTGFRNGQAKKYCITAEPVQPANMYKHGFMPGVNYMAKLTVENDCGDEAVETINFTLPSLPAQGCYEVPGEVIIKSVYPNPFSGQLNVEYELYREGYLEIWLLPSNPAGNNILLSTEYINNAGIYQKNITTSQVTSGVYYLILDLDGDTVGQTTIRI